MNYQNILSQVKNNPQMMGNQTVKNVFECLAKRDHNALVEIYKNTCSSVGQEPNQMFLR